MWALNTCGRQTKSGCPPLTGYFTGTLSQASNKRYKPSPKNPYHFIVQHYAGPVGYDGEGFLEKNRDTLNFDLIELLQKSTSGFINTLYAPRKRAVIHFGWVFFLISLGGRAPRVLRAHMWALNTCGEPNDIELTAAHG